ncbi:MAG: MmcQ/YjbR family DNA-binding protein, partial [Myxococcota bacterium]
STCRREPVAIQPIAQHSSSDTESAHVELEDIRELCLSKPFVTEGFPFDSSTLVLKVHGKMFALMGLEVYPSTVHLKCEPERAIELREQYDAVAPGYHMNKRHWNTLTLDGSLPSALVAELVEHSYDRVVAGLKKAQREEIRAALEH